jgi:hypothetical protein
MRKEPDEAAVNRIEAGVWLLVPTAFWTRVS